MSPVSRCTSYVVCVYDYHVSYVAHDAHRARSYSVLHTCAKPASGLPRHVHDCLCTGTTVPPLLPLTHAVDACEISVGNTASSIAPGVPGAYLNTYSASSCPTYVTSTCTFLVSPSYRLTLYATPCSNGLRTVHVPVPDT